MEIKINPQSRRLIRLRTLEHEHLLSGAHLSLFSRRNALQKILSRIEKKYNF